MTPIQKVVEINERYGMEAFVLEWKPVSMV